MDERNDELFDDLFEPFELDEGPPPPSDAATTPAEEPVAEIDRPRAGPMLPCPSCGTPNPAHNRHCEACGARLSHDPLPVAPPPLGGASPGARALTVLGVVVLIAAVIAFIMNIRGDESATPTTTAPSTTSTTAVPFEELQPTSVSASSELNDSYSAQNLLDNDTNTEWQDSSQRGDGAQITFTFAQPVRIASIEIVNVPDEARFKRNYRIKGWVIEVDDINFDYSGELTDSNEPQRIQLGTVGTTTLTLDVRTTYPAETIDGQVPFSELAISDVRFFGSAVG